MTYLADFRVQVLKSIKQQGMNIRQACAFYDISKATLQNWLKDPSIKLTRNKPHSKIPNEALLKDVEQYPDDYMYERGFEHENLRPSSYAPIGKPCIDSYNWQAKKRTNVIGALYERALFALDYFEKNINGDVFYNWCKHTLIPSLKTKCVIVMDKASFHKRVQKLLNRHGHRLLFLPPYSPDLNPIEKK